MTMTPAQRADWLAWRRHGIGASDIGAIVGLSPYRSRYAVWADKVGAAPPEPETAAMSHGRYAEHAIRAWFDDTYPELIVFGGQERCEHPAMPYVRCTPDGWLAESTAGSIDDRYVTRSAVGLIEYKVADWREWDEIPAGYQAQAQWQMLTTDMPVVIFAVQHGKRFKRYDLERDTDDIAYLLTEGERFWNDHCLTGLAPEVDAHPSTSWVLDHRWAAAETSVALDDMADVVNELRYAKEQEKWWADKGELLTNRLKERLGDASVGKIGDDVAVTWNASTSRTIDVKRLRAEQPSIAADYQTVTEFRRFLVKKAKG